jgi:hypothetical protein
MAGNDHPEIYAHQTTRHHLDRIVNITRDTTYRRAMRQFGVLLPPGGLVNAGVGSRLLFDQHSTPGLLYPTKTYDDRMELEIAGVRLVLIQSRGRRRTRPSSGCRTRTHCFAPTIITSPFPTFTPSAARPTGT